MARPSKEKLDQIIVLLNEIKSDLNGLRTDFRAHDHGVAYTAATTRLNAVANAFSGTAEASSGVASDDAPENPYTP